ncbi:MAG: transcription antitermination factor NusB, partial [Candidatus Gottesmanbacteria bacterium]|nr:transcription antitermination factor NusB [Candidatus Gottesmanbacteria bacterium]
HQHRREIMDSLFAFSFDSAQVTPDIQPILPTLPDIDERIHVAAPEWPVDKIAKIDLAVLRLAVFELTVEKKEPPKVIIDEAIELAKEYGNEHSSKFVNGVLGTILKTVTEKGSINI